MSYRTIPLSQVSELERSPTTRRNAAFQGPSFPSTPPIGFQHFIPTQHANVTHTMQVWLLDQFGVLHDGKQPYPGAISTCKYYYSTLSLFFNLFLNVSEALSSAKIVSLNQSQKVLLCFFNTQFFDIFELLPNSQFLLFADFSICFSFHWNAQIG